HDYRETDEAGDGNSDGCEGVAIARKSRRPSTNLLVGAGLVLGELAQQRDSAAAPPDEKGRNGRRGEDGEARQEGMSLPAGAVDGASGVKPEVPERRRTGGRPGEDVVALVQRIHAVLQRRVEKSCMAFRRARIIGFVSLHPLCSEMD